MTGIEIDKIPIGKVRAELIKKLKQYLKKKDGWSVSKSMGNDELFNAEVNDYETCYIILKMKGWCLDGMTINFIAYEDNKDDIEGEKRISLNIELDSSEPINFKEFAKKVKAFVNREA